MDTTRRGGDHAVTGQGSVRSLSVVPEPGAVPEAMEGHPAPPAATTARVHESRSGGDHIARLASPGSDGAAQPRGMSIRSASMRRVLKHQRAIAGHHARRLHVYLGRVLVRSLPGLWRCIVELCRWTFDADGRQMIGHATLRADGEEYLSLVRRHDQRVHNRMPVGAAAFVIPFGAVVAAVALVPGPIHQTAVVLVVAIVFGVVGSPKDQPWIEPPVVAPSAVRITADLLVQAFAAARLCSLEPESKPGPITQLTPVVADVGAIRADVALPPGKTVAEAVAARDRIASGLDIDARRLVIEGIKGASQRRVRVWVADGDPFVQPQSLSLVDEDDWDLWRPIPFGFDARGETIRLSVVQRSILVGGMPDSGKTGAMTAVAAAAVLDPATRLIVIDGKGGKDWRPLSQVAHFFAAGVQRSTIEAVVEILRQAETDMRSRYERIADMPDEICPESSVTPELTTNPEHGMPLVLIVVDEVQEYLSDPDHGKTILDLLVKLRRLGRAAGIILMLGTQRPDAKTMAESLRANMDLRFALRVKNRLSSEAILGEGAYRQGFDASSLAELPGVGILMGTPEGGVTLRTLQVTHSELRRICERGRELRLQAGTLTGNAAGETTTEAAEPPGHRLLGDIAAVFEPDEERLWSETICERLVARWPDRYQDLVRPAATGNRNDSSWAGPRRLGRQVSAIGVETKQIDLAVTAGKRENKRGLYRSHVQAALARTGEQHRGGTVTALDRTVVNET